MKEFDALDMRILHELLRNSRTPFSTLAKKVRTKRENCMYRFARMQKLGLIKSANAIVDTERLGFAQYALFIQYSSITKKREEEFIKTLEKRRTSWVGTLAGKWNIVLDIYAKDDCDLENQLQFILSFLSSNIKEYSLLRLKKKEYSLQPNQTKKENGQRFDNIDFRIMSFLNKDARTSYATLSKELKLTANAIRKRIKHLEKSGMIKAYTLVIDYHKLRKEIYGLQLKASQLDAKLSNNVRDYCRNNPSIVFCYEYFLGDWDFDIGVMIDDAKEIRTIINDIKVNLEDVTVEGFYLLLEELMDGQLNDKFFT